MTQITLCPKCQAPLPVDSPEGLCPACLLAGGMASELMGENGSASTTPWRNAETAAAIEELAPHFPQLEILELLGQGGMGTVYKCRQKHLDRLVALKVIPPVAARDPAFAERFAREARALARLNHPNIVTVYDFGCSDGVFYLLMEFVDGPNLRQTMQSGSLTPREALAIVPSICDALQYAHDQGIVHRDIKPENVLLDRSGRIKIADFGLAKLLHASPQDFTLTRSMQIMGTPRYMAPEQVEHPSEVDHRADIYSLGVVLYEMLTGELPMGRFAPPSQKVELDIRIDEIVLRTLEKEPSRRFQRVSEVRTELDSVHATPAQQGATSHDRRMRSDGKANGSADQISPAGFSHGLATQFLLVGGMFAVSLLIIGVGFMIGGIPIAWNISGSDSMGYFGAAFGCIVGGFGSLLGTFNTYRQLAGKPGWMEAEFRTWLDRIMLGYLLVGIAGLLIGLVVMSTSTNVDEVQSGYSFIWLGLIMVIQGGIFLVYRTAYRTGKGAGKTTAGSSPASRLQATVPAKPLTERDLARIQSQVVGPGTGLVVAGICGLLPLVLFILLAVGMLAIGTAHLQADAETTGEKIMIREVAYTEGLPGSTTFPVANHLPLMMAQTSPHAETLGMRMPIFLVFAAAIVLVPAFPFSILIIVGGMKMRRLQSRGLAMTAACLALIPVGPGWLISLPMGIWALSVLLRADVWEAFQLRAQAE